MDRHWTPEDIANQAGRTLLITGANSGIGLETTRVLAGREARVLLAGRDQVRLDEAARTIRAGSPRAELRTLVLDLADLTSVAAAAKEVAESETVDLLINNAGVMNLPRRQTTRDGFEMTFGTNHLGHFAFDAQVWPAVRRSPAARVVTVSALAARWPSGKLEDLMSERRYRPMGAYAKSKRANVVYTLELARRTAGTPVEAVVIHPGAAMTSLQRSSGGLTRLLTPLTRLAMGSPAGAAWPTLWAATSPDARSGQFIGPAGIDQTTGRPSRCDSPEAPTTPRKAPACGRTVSTSPASPSPSDRS